MTTDAAPWSLAGLRLSLADRVGSALDLRPGEGRRTAWLFLQLLLASAVFILGRTVRDTLFLSRYPVSALPWMFVAYGGVSSVVAVLYGRYADRVPRHAMLAASAALGGVTYVATWGLVTGSATWVYPAFYVWSEVVANLFIVQFWTLANELNDPRAGKRLFGVIGSARVLGVVLVGTTTGAVVRVIGTTNLLFLLVALMVAVAAIGWALRAEPRPSAGPPPRQGAPPTSILGDAYVRALALLLLLTFTALTLGDYQFKVVARATYREDALAQFFALFYAATGVVSFVFQVLVTPRLLRSLGVGPSLAVMPGTFGVASLILPFFPNLGVATVMKFADNGFQYTVHDTTLQALYVPFPPHAKARTRALLEAVIKPCAYGAGGLLLVLLAQRLPVAQLSFVTLALTALWLALIPRVRALYQRSLQGTLSARGALALDSEFLLDAAGRKALIEVLDRGEPSFTVTALEQLATDPSPEVAAAVQRLTRSPDPEIRRAALEHLALQPRGTSTVSCAEALHDLHPEARAAGARAHAVALGDACVAAVAPLLHDPDRGVRVSAAVALLRDAGVAGAIAGGTHLGGLLTHPDAAHRAEAAAVLGRLGPTACSPLLELLHDADPGVRRAALRSAEGVADARLVEPLAELLVDPSCRVAAGHALSAIGAPAVPRLAAALRDPATPRAVRLLLPRILRATEHRDAWEALQAFTRLEDSHLRLRVLAGLVHLRRTLRLGPQPLEWVHAQVEFELRDGYRTLAGWDRARAEYPSELLAQEMALRESRVVRRVVRALQLRYPVLPLALALERLGDPRRRTNAIETLDSLLDARLRPLVMGWLEEGTPTERLRRAPLSLPAAPDPEAFLAEQCTHPNPYVALVSLDALARHPGPRTTALAEGALTHRDPLVREGGILALAAAAPERAAELLPALTADPDPSVAQHARHRLALLGRAPALDIPMHSTLEKVLFLKSTALFGDVEAEDLAPLARVAAQEAHDPGSVIFREGERGDSLYIVVRGQVAISAGGERVAVLGPGEALGEMAVLDSAPRSATATALEQTELLRIGSEEFYEILHEQTEIASGVIRMLVRRLRETTASAAAS